MECPVFRDVWSGGQDQKQTLLNPPPAHGGASCAGDAFDSQACQQQDCPGKLKKNPPNMKPFYLNKRMSVILYVFQLSMDQ